VYLKQAAFHGEERFLSSSLFDTNGTTENGGKALKEGKNKVADLRELGTPNSAPKRKKNSHLHATSDT